MIIGSVSENKNLEKRISITPEIAKKYINLGFNLSLPNNYGDHLGFNDDEYKNSGVNLLDNEKELINTADIIIQLGLPDDKKLSLFKENQTLIGSLNAFLNKEDFGCAPCVVVYENNKKEILNVPFNAVDLSFDDVTINKKSSFNFEFIY